VSRATPAGDFDYEATGRSYSAHRRPDPVIAAQITAALGDARTVLNVGAGAGSYEPDDRLVLAVEPSASMRSQRPPGLAPAIDAVAEQLPFDDGSFDAAMATITVHQWTDLDRGLAEMRRVSRDRVLVMAFDPERAERFWLAELAPALTESMARRDPPIDRIVAALDPDADVQAVRIPIDCADGFVEAFYGRPEAYLDPEVRRAQSVWGFVDDADEERIVADLARMLESGEWDRRWGEWRQRECFEGSLRLIVADVSR